MSITNDARGAGQRESKRIQTYGPITQWCVGYFMPNGKRELTVGMRVPKPNGGWENRTVIFTSERDALTMAEFWTQHPHREGAFDYVVSGY